MKQNRFIRESGPYEVHSISQDGRGVRLEIYPAFPQYNLTEKERQDKDIDPDWAKEPRWPLHRYKGDGGGPSIYTALALACEFEEFLNQPYTEADVKQWKELNDQALRKVREHEQKRFEKAMAKFEKEASPD